MQNNYMYARMKKSLPELYAFTICMWLKSKALGGLGTPFSYSVPSQSNEIVLLEWGSNPLELLINDKVSPATGGVGGKPLPSFPLLQPSWEMMLLGVLVWGSWEEGAWNGGGGRTMGRMAQWGVF